MWSFRKKVRKAGANRRLWLDDMRDPAAFGYHGYHWVKNYDQAIAALNGTNVDGRALNVNEARPKTERGFGGGQRRNNRW